MRLEFVWAGIMLTLLVVALAASIGLRLQPAEWMRTVRLAAGGAFLVTVSLPFLGIALLSLTERIQDRPSNNE